LILTYLGLARYLWLDPGSPEVAERLLAVIEDIVSRYKTVWKIQVLFGL